MDLIRPFIDHIKNFQGFKTNRRIVVFVVDDYGNVRVASRKARKLMDKAGLKTLSRFDAYDSLETREDLEILFDTLSSVKDKIGYHAVLTPFALPCNIDFERMEAENYQDYRYETLPATYHKLTEYQTSAYTGAWDLWNEGISKGFMSPQFHGREHLNLKVFREKLAQKDHELITALKNRSFTSISHSGYSTISITAAFDFWDFQENENFPEIITDGLEKFENVFGNKPVHYNAPGAADHHTLHKVLKENGIRFVDTPWLKKEHQGFGKYKRWLNHTGEKTPEGMVKLVRNVVFEPTELKTTDWVGCTLRQINAAFRMKKPAIISSHRVNFSGNIDPDNRSRGIKSLKELLSIITQKYPDVEFMSSAELGVIIENTNNLRG